MAIAINPDVRELDFSDNVKVSKFMQDFSDFRAKKWITYRPVNAPSESDPFLGGTRQFIINMGTGHILDTTYSGLWFTLYLENKSDVLTWPLQASLPRTSTAWIESVTFQHSKVAAHIDERLCDYDAVTASFVPAKDVLSMKQTFFTTEGQVFTDGSMFNEAIEDDPYCKLFPVGTFTTKRLNYAVKSFFIPLSRLSTIFNSGKYFFPSLLRGNGEMTLSIRSVADSLSSIFGGSRSSLAIYAGMNSADCIWSCSNNNKNVDWVVAMTDMRLVTLNLDNAFLTKEYNAFIASGRKFIRSFKGFNYQFYQVLPGKNRIEIANTHQSISHVVLAFQCPYSIRHNGAPTSVSQNQYLGIQATAAPGSSGNMFSPNLVLTQGAPPSGGGAASQYPMTGSRKGPTTLGSNNYPTLNNSNGNGNGGQKALNVGSAPPKENILRSGSRKAANIVRGAVRGATNYVAENGPEVLAALSAATGVAASIYEPKSTEAMVANAFSVVTEAVSRALSTKRGSEPRPEPLTAQLTTEQKKEAKAVELYDQFIDSVIPKRYSSNDVVRHLIQDLNEKITVINNQSSGAKFALTKANVEEFIKIIFQGDKITDPGLARVRDAYNAIKGDKGLTPYQAALVAYLFDSNNSDLSEAVKEYLNTLQANRIIVDSEDILTTLIKYQVQEKQAEAQLPKTLMQSRITVGGTEINGASDIVADAILNNLLPFTKTGEDGEVFNEEQNAALFSLVASMLDNDRIAWHRYYTHMVPAEPKQVYDLGMNIIENLQVYRGTGNGETVFSEPINENMFYHVSREALGDVAENHPYFNYASFRKDTATITISLNTFMRDAHHEFWDGFSTNRVADRLYVEFELIPLSIDSYSQIMPWYRDVGYNNNNGELNCKVFTIYDNIYYIDRDNNLNVSDTLLPLQEGRIPGSD